MIWKLKWYFHFSHSGEKSEKTGQPINFTIDQTDAVRMEDVIRDLLTRADQVDLT